MSHKQVAIFYAIGIPAAIFIAAVLNVLVIATDLLPLP